MNKLQIAGLSALTLLGSMTAIQAQATTPPVGYVTLASVSNPIPANTDVRLSVPMEASVDFTGLAASFELNDLTVAGGAFAADEFAPATGGYYLRIKNGASAGQTAEITANTADTLSVAFEAGDDFANVDATTQIEIVKYFTLNTFFPSNLPTGTKILFFSSVAGINSSSTDTITWSGTQWKQGFSVVDATLYPGESFILRTPDTAITDIVITGNVPTVSHRIKLVSINGSEQDFSVSYLSPVSELIGDSGLGITAGDKLLVYDRTVGINKGAAQTITYSGTVWKIGFTDVSDTFSLEPGAGYVLRRAAVTAGTYEWSNTQTYNN